MLFASKIEDKVILLIIIQSSVVRGSLVRIRKGQLPLFLYNTSKSIRRSDQADGAYLLKTTTSHIKRVTEDASKEYSAYVHGDNTLPKHISNIHFVLSSPWVISHALFLRKNFETNSNVSEKTIVDMLAGERSKFLPGNAEDLVVIEEKIFDVRLNGYSIEDWKGKSAHTIELAFAASAAGRKAISSFREACGHVAKENNISFHSGLLLHHVGIQHIFPGKRDYILVNVHGEITDVVVVNGRMCSFFGSLNMGINNVVRDIGEEMKVSEQVAESLFTLYIGGKLGTDQQEKMKKVVDNISLKWSTKIHELLDGVVEAARLPEDVMIVARIHESFFVNSFTSHFKVKQVDLITNEMVADYVEFLPKVEKLRLAALYAVALTIIR